MHHAVSFKAMVGVTLENIESESVGELSDESSGEVDGEDDEWEDIFALGGEVASKGGGMCDIGGEPLVGGGSVEVGGESLHIRAASCG